MKIVDNVALIENRLLCAAIWGDESCVNKAPRFSGYVNASIDEAGKAFIEYCIAKIYGIFRLPQCGYDNYLSGRCNYNSLDANEVMNCSKAIIFRPCFRFTKIRKMRETENSSVG